MNTAKKMIGETMAKLKVKTLGEKFLALYQSILRGAGMTYHQKMIRSASFLEIIMSLLNVQLSLCMMPAKKS